MMPNEVPRLDIKGMNEVWHDMASGWGFPHGCFQDILWMEKNPAPVGRQ